MCRGVLEGRGRRGRKEGRNVRGEGGGEEGGGGSFFLAD